MVDARRKSAIKRNGRGPAGAKTFAAPSSDEEVLAIDQALRKLESIDRRKAQVVELKYFGGLTIDETAESLSISTASVERDWTMAKAWLFRELHGRGKDWSAEA